MREDCFVIKNKLSQKFYFIKMRETVGGNVHFDRQFYMFRTHPYGLLYVILIM